MSNECNELGSWCRLVFVINQTTDQMLVQRMQER